jgi:hypothetical protein
MCIILLFLLCSLITFNMPHNLWSAVTSTITLKAIIMTRINFSSQLNCLLFSCCLFLKLCQTSCISQAREWTRVYQNKLTNLAYSFHICSPLSLLLQIIVCLYLNNNRNPKIWAHDVTCFDYNPTINQQCSSPTHPHLAVAPTVHTFCGWKRSSGGNTRPGSNDILFCLKILCVYSPGIKSHSNNARK